MEVRETGYLPQYISLKIFAGFLYIFSNYLTNFLSLLAPELLNFDPVGPGSDMWSVAVIMYILLSGISPFFYEDEDKVLECVQRVRWKFDEAAFESVTMEAKDFIKKCFVRIPE